MTATATPPAKQSELNGNGFEVPRDEEIEGAAERYRNIRNERMELTEEEVESREALEKLLHDKGLKDYKYRPEGEEEYFEVVLESTEKATVRKAKAGGSRKKKTEPEPKGD